MCKVQRTVALSTTEGELMAGTEATTEAICNEELTDVQFALNLDNNMSGKMSQGILKCELRGDYQSSLSLSVNLIYHQRTKDIQIRHRFICDMVNEGIITVSDVPSTDMLADGFTKPLARDVHADHCTRIGLKLYPDIPSINSAIHNAHMSVTRKRKLRYNECGNLFADENALSKHKLKKET